MSVVLNNLGICVFQEFQISDCIVADSYILLHTSQKVLDI